jgi:radical SAM superfamily enzyme YgiQ (UPF0313 family)
MKILLTSVFGPYGVDDSYGRKENVMELFHNQVTREQEVFSLRFHHPSFGLYFIAENIEAPTVVLDFPSEARFVREIKKGYDYVGISFIVPNFVKAKRMGELIRHHAPNSKILLGSHGTNLPGIEKMIEHDHICRGEGVRWFRKLLSEKVDRPLHHPTIESGFSRKIMGVPLKTDTAALIPGVGCPNACRFCATSHFFQKAYTPFFDTGRELFEICRRIERETGHTDFVIMDENFLKRPQRARELVELMERHHKYYRFSLFSSAETIRDVGVEFLARLGAYFLWMGVESKVDLYEKNKGIDLKDMIRQLRDHGIFVLASGILFLEHHTKQSIWEDIDYLVGLESDLVQFMGLGPMPGTALYKDYDDRGLLLKEMPYEEWHGQHQIWFRHPHFSGPESARYLKAAFRHDYDTQGSSLLRMCDTVVRGYHTLSRHNDAFMRGRARGLREQARLHHQVLPGCLKHAHNDLVREKTLAVMANYQQTFGSMTTIQKVRVAIARRYTAREVWRIKSHRHIYQPKTMYTAYRISAKQRAVYSLRHALKQWKGTGQPVLEANPSCRNVAR